MVMSKLNNAIQNIKQQEATLKESIASSFSNTSADPLLILSSQNYVIRIKKF